MSNENFERDTGYSRSGRASYSLDGTELLEIYEAGQRSVLRTEPGQARGFTDESGGGALIVACNVCKEVFTGPNKGLVRANLGAWKTRHQHLDED